MPPAAVIAAKELESIPANVEQEVEVGHGRAATTRTDSWPCHTHGRAVDDFVSFGGPQEKTPHRVSAQSGNAVLRLHHPTVITEIK